jgi:hypothetical protein
VDFKKYWLMTATNPADVAAAQALGTCEGVASGRGSLGGAVGEGVKVGDQLLRQVAIVKVILGNKY